jgi:hypothetical protein
MMVGGLVFSQKVVAARITSVLLIPGVIHRGKVMSTTAPEATASQRDGSSVVPALMGVAVGNPTPSSSAFLSNFVKLYSSKALDWGIFFSGHHSLAKLFRNPHLFMNCTRVCLWWSFPPPPPPPRATNRR